MQHLKRTILTAFAGITGALGIWADAADLFVPIATSPELNGGVSGGTKERLVRIARSELANVRGLVTHTGTGRLLLNVDDDLQLGGVVERTSTTRWGYSLSGRIDSPTAGFVTLVVHDEAVAGAIWTPDASYEVVHLGAGVHAVREAAENQRQCGGSVAAFEGQSFVWPENGHAVDEDTVVDVLVVWTPQREEEVGGADTVRAEIELGIAYTNDAFERSGAFVSLNLVGAEPVTDYEEPNVDDLGDLAFLTRLRTEHGRLVDPSDGHMDAIHHRRDALGADLVSLATHYGPPRRDGARGGGVASSYASVSVYGSPRVVAHEFGHNFGLGHERDEWWGGGVGHYQHGYVALRRSRCTSTIMAYGELCARNFRYGVQVDHVPLFSSPTLFRTIDGAPLGVSRFSERRGPDGPADAVLQLNRARDTIAGFRPSRSRLD